MKSIFKYFLTCFALLFLLNGCKDEEVFIEESSINQEFQIRHKPFDFFNQNTALTNKLAKLSSTKKGAASNKSTISTEDFTIFTERVTYIAPTDGSRESFSFYIERPNGRNNHLIENLILSKQTEDDQYKAHIITYSFPEGVESESDNFEVTSFEEIDISTVSNLTGRCESEYEYSISEIKHDCYTGEHNGIDEAGECEGGAEPYSTWKISVKVTSVCSGDEPGGGSGLGGGLGGGQGGGTGSGNPPGGGGPPVDTGISLPPSCQTNNCDSELPANQINVLLGETLNPEQLLYLNGNQLLSNLIMNELEASSNSSEAVSASIITIQMATAGKMGASAQDPAVQAAYNLHLPRIGISPTLFVQYYFYFSTECAILRRQNPTWSSAKIYWNASLETVHIALDLAGLIPLVGEVFDATNGVLYTIEGDGVNASLSFAAAIPLAGWFATGAKFGWKGSLKFVVKADGVISFGTRNSGKFRKAVGLVPGDLSKQAHHLLSRNLRGHRAIQKAAKSKLAFHIDEVLNGVPIASWRNQFNHPIYDANVKALLDAIPSNLTDLETFNAVSDVINQVRTVVTNNPGLHLNDLVF